MKTAISLPDQVFEGVERGAAELGISRSEFFARAAQRYIDELDRNSLTERINAALAVTGPDDSNADAAAAGRRLLSKIDDEW